MTWGFLSVFSPNVSGLNLGVREKHPDWEALLESALLEECSAPANLLELVRQHNTSAAGLNRSNSLRPGGGASFPLRPCQEPHRPQVFNNSSDDLNICNAAFISGKRERCRWWIDKTTFPDSRENTAVGCWAPGVIGEFQWLIFALLTHAGMQNLLYFILNS